ncbi:MAG TPA: hypothetical protein VKP30_08700 [Polyangiaceae bacterium]|nr:hypothetical protein [Polyangiaceae bacterium]
MAIEGATSTRSPGWQWSTRRASYVLWALGGVAGAFAGCVYDPDNICGPHQVVYLDKVRCICEPNAALTAAGCVPCGEHEVPGQSGCVCDAGFSRPAEGGACVAATSAQGTACSAATPCTDANYSYCALDSSGSGYCTKSGCTTAAECEGGYDCNTGVTPSICRRPPVGAGKACTSAAECAGTDATFCDSMMKVCIVEGCTVTPNNCFSGYLCCDLSKFGVPNPICIQGEACP